MHKKNWEIKYKYIIICLGFTIMLLSFMLLRSGEMGGWEPLSRHTFAITTGSSSSGTSVTSVAVLSSLYIWRCWCKTVCNKHCSCWYINMLTTITTITNSTAPLFVYIRLPSPIFFMKWRLFLHPMIWRGYFYQPR